MEYVQIIEFQTRRFDEVEALHERGLADTEGVRTTISEVVVRDRDRPDTYLVIVRFPSAEAAAVNNDLPATAAFAAGLNDVIDGPPTFRNLDLVRMDT